jgi:hypothetical protein
MRRMHGARRRRNPLDRKSQNILVVAGVAIGGFLLWMFSKNASAADMAAGGSAGGALSMNPTLSPISLPSGLYSGTSGSSPSGSTSIYQSSLPAPTTLQVNRQATIWGNLMPTAFPGTSGWVNFPSGSQAAASLLPWRTDGSNFYTNWAGVVFAVPLSTDQYGNYTAVQA